MSNERGAALVIAVMAVALLAALGLSLAVLSGVETRIAGNFSQALEARAAAECALEFSVHALQATADWDAVAAGTIMSTFADGPPGPRQLSDGSSLDLAQVTATLGEPGWRLFAYGPLSALTNVTSSNMYIVVWAGPDPAGRESTMVLRADAFGPAGTRRAVQAAVSRTAVLSWSSR